MNYTETNKLINKFVNDCEMGVYSEDGDFVHSSICGVDADSAFYRWEDMKFHTSWDWLVPAFVKWLKASNELPESGYRDKHILIYKQLFLGCLFAGDVKAAHAALVNGINWYNSNLPTPSIA